MKAMILILISFLALQQVGTAQEGIPAKDDSTISERPLAQEGSQIRWVQTMEASVHPAFPTTKSELSHSDLVITWMGWATALVFFLVLLSLHLKIRRREQLLIRAGERDLDIFPPARNRRRFPR